MSDESDSPELELGARGINTETLPFDAIISTMRNNATRLQQREARAQALPESLGFAPNVGAYMPEPTLSWAAHRELILDPPLALSFHTEFMPGFDAYLPSATRSPSLQINLAVLRNFLLSQYASRLPPANVAVRMREIAQFLNERLFAPPPWLVFGLRINAHEANQPGTGAQHLYQTLLRRQQEPVWLTPSLWFGTSRPALWQLPPLEATPFSNDALKRPPLKPDTRLSVVAFAEPLPEMATRASRSEPEAATQQEEELSPTQELNAIANDIASAGALSMSVEQMSEPAKRESVEIAKDILNKLRIKLGTALVSEGLSLFDKEKLSILGALRQAVQSFEMHLHKLAGMDPAIYDNPAVKRANRAVGKLSFVAKQETLRAAVNLGDAKMVSLIEAELQQLPLSWSPEKDETFAQLFIDVENGLDALLNRLIQMNEQDASTSYWLGFSSARSISGSDPSLGGKDKEQKAMADDDFYRQMNAQRALRARQAAVRYMQSMKRQQDHAEDHAPPQPEPAKGSMSQLLSSDQIASMRSAMKTSANAGQVETGTKATLQQTLNQKEQSQRAQRQRITVEQVSRANKRSKEQQEPEPTPPPGPKKRDHGHGF